jgi:hypothetical protein
MRDPNLMPVIDGSGSYNYIPGTLTLVTSTHPVYKARIDLGLPQNVWLYAPVGVGHDLDSYKTVRETAAQLQKFEKDLLFYLQSYGPEVTDALVARGAVSLNLEIAEDALNA